MGGFWLGHLAKDTGLMLKTGASRIKKVTLFNSKQVRGFCVQNPYQ
jgi:hypothetical protein